MTDTTCTTRLTLLLGEPDAAAALGLTQRTLQQWRRDGGGPPYVRVSSRCVRYRVSDLDAWAAERVYGSTSEEHPVDTGPATG